MKIKQLLFVFLAFLFMSIASTQVFGQEMGNACKFDAGPRAGQTQDYSQHPPAPLGTPCFDGQNPPSTGKVVSTKPIGDGGGMGNACKFDAGPRAGQTQDYSQLPPLPIGSPCQDGEGSTGKVVSTKITTNASSNNSNNVNSNNSNNKSKTCMLLRGSKKGTKENFPISLPINSPCLTRNGLGIIVK
jgi:hypothetical protein